MSRFALFACLAAFVVVQRSDSQESYRIQIRKEGKAGDRFYVLQVEKATQKTLLTDAAGKVLNKSDEQLDRSEIYEESILAKEPGVFSAATIRGTIEVKVTADVPTPNGQKAALKITANSSMTETRKELK
jgi:hypothetical protein